MITLYQGSGTSSFEVEGLVMADDDWQKLLYSTVCLLKRHGNTEAADLLETGGFSLHHGTNDFNDDFCVLYRKANLDDYIQFEEYSRSTQMLSAYVDIANTMYNIGQYIRFICVELDIELTNQVIASPIPHITSAVVQMALNDAEHMVSNGSAVSAVDRAHTALHGYLKQICFEANLETDVDDLSLTYLLKLLREQHPKLSCDASHKAHVGKVLKAMGAICDALNPIRNQGSLAHPNLELLDEADAMLAINASRTLFLYFQQKLDS